MKVCVGVFGSVHIAEKSASSPLNAATSGRPRALEEKVARRFTAGAREHGMRTHCRGLFRRSGLLVLAGVLPAMSGQEASVPWSEMEKFFAPPKEFVGKFGDYRP